MTILYCNIPGVTNVIAVTVNQSHNATTASATVNCTSTALDIGDAITIDLGYTTSHGLVFSGRVKMIERQVPDDTLNITCQDELIKAVDYYIVSNDPEVPFSYTNITAEDLVWNLLSMANITDYDYQASMFTFAVNGTVAEVNLISAYDYCKKIADVITWGLWSDNYDRIQFKNRKPYVMDGLSGQPGDIADIPITYTLDDTNATGFNYRTSEDDLRNRVVVYGANGIKAEAYATSPYLPNLPGKPFYKTIVVGTDILDDQTMADNSCAYNLAMWNRLNRVATPTAFGHYLLQARSVVPVVETYSGLSENMYIFSANHQWSKSGYTVQLMLKGV